MRYDGQLDSCLEKLPGQNLVQHFPCAALVLACNIMVARAHDFVEIDLENVSDRVDVCSFGNAFLVHLKMHLVHVHVLARNLLLSLPKATSFSWRETNGGTACVYKSLMLPLFLSLTQALLSLLFRDWGS